MDNLTLQHWSLVAERLLLLLADVTVKSFLLFLAAGVFALALRRASAAYRQLVWLLAFVCMLALPALTFLVPGREVTAVSHAVRVMPIPSHSTPVHGEPVVVQVNGRPVPAAISPVPDLPVPVGLSPIVQRQIDAYLVGAFCLLLAAIWIVGTAVVALPTVLALLGLRRLSRQLAPPAGDAAAVAAEVASGTWRHVRVAVATPPSAITVPMTWGFLRPVIALPADAAEWTRERLQAVLLHEMAHVRRGDWMAQVTASVVSALYWFNPLVWLAARAMRTESERAADDYVVTHGMDAPVYAGHLLQIALAARDRRRVPRLCVPMVRQPHIETRLRQMLAPHPREQVTARRRAVALGVTVCLLLLGSAFRFSGRIVQNNMAAPISGDVAADAQVAPTAQSSVTLSNGAVISLAGVLDTQAGSEHAWSANGSPLVVQLPKNTLVFRNMPQNVSGRAFAFRIAYDPATQPQTVWTTSPDFGYDYNPDATHPGVYSKKADWTYEFKPDENITSLGRYQQEESKHGGLATSLVINAQAFRTSDRTCTVNVAASAGPWTQTVECPKVAGKTRVETPSGEVIFTLIPNPHHLKDSQAIRRGNAVFMVTDQFDNMATPTTPPVQHERNVLALDSMGRAVYDLRGTLVPNADGSGKCEQATNVPNSILMRVASFRLSARPYQWAAFRNVQLQPQASLAHQ